MTTCELCKTNYRIIARETGDKFKGLRYVGAVALDLALFISLFVALYLFAGFIGDIALTGAIKSLLQNGPTVNGSCTLVYMRFLCSPIFQGRIWFWGFICFFFVLGVVGVIFACCYKDSGSANHSYGHDSYSNNTCWWVWCGPSYYNGYYYYSPYGYWGPGDLMCYWCLVNDMHYHHHSHAGCAGCAGCSGGDCTGCDTSGCSGNGDCGKEGFIIIIVIVIIIVAVFVIIGIVFGSIITFLIVNKVMKRHLTILEKQAFSKKYFVCNLDDPNEVQEADNCNDQFAEVIVSVNDESKQPLNKPPKGKEFDVY